MCRNYRSSLSLCPVCVFIALKCVLVCVRVIILRIGSGASKYHLFSGASATQHVLNYVPLSTALLL